LTGKRSVPGLDAIAEKLKPLRVEKSFVVELAEMVQRGPQVRRFSGRGALQAATRAVVFKGTHRLAARTASLTVEPTGSVIFMAAGFIA
jgi:hypothetical protein